MQISKQPQRPPLPDEVILGLQPPVLGFPSHTAQWFPWHSQQHGPGMKTLTMLTLGAQPPHGQTSAWFGMKVGEQKA